MYNAYFHRLEEYSKGASIPLQEMLEHLSFNQDGLIPAIAQHFQTREVLMMAWMNRESLIQTLESKRMTYWSRGRNRLWLKGESSGNYQHVRSLHLDCDGDTLLFLVQPDGPACHTGRRHCFYFESEGHFKNATLSLTRPE